MPVLHKITREAYDVEVNKIPPLDIIRCFDGIKTRVTDKLGVVVKRGEYKHIVFIPNALLAMPWNVVFNKYNGTYDGNAVIDSGVFFLFDKVVV